MFESPQSRRGSKEKRRLDPPKGRRSNVYEGKDAMIQPETPPTGQQDVINKNQGGHEDGQQIRLFLV